MKKNKKNDKVKKVTKKSERSSANLAGISIFIFLLDKLSDSIYNMFVNGFFGRIFSSYSAELSSYENGQLLAYFKGTNKSCNFFRKIRMFLSCHFENSFILKLLRKGVRSLAFATLKSYGCFFLAFGIYTMIVYLIKKFIPVTGEANIDHMFIGIYICLISIPLYFSRKPLAIAVKNSRMLGALFVDAFGYREEKFDDINLNTDSKTGVAILLGLIAGILTFAITPLSIIIALLFLVVITLVIISPEIGVLICIFGLPFCSFLSNPTLILTSAVILTTFSYVIKLIRGKRIFHLELLDVVVLIFSIIIFFSGAITMGGKASYYAAIVSCVLLFGYFFVVNLMRTDIWIKRCILALVTSGTIVAIIGVLQYALGAAVNDWLDLKYFSDIYGRTTSLFENPNYLAAYLALIFPFAIYLTFASRTKKETLLCILCDLIIVLCTVFTWSRGAWLAMLICLVVQCTIYSRKTLRLVWLSIAALPILPFVLPNNLVARFLSIGNLSDSSIMYRMYTWRGSMNMIKDYFWGGIGYGAESFSEIYPQYAYAGMESAAHSHSLFLQILLGVGIGGLVCFILILVFYTQKSFEYLRAPSDRLSFMRTVSAMTAVVALTIMGIFDYVWYNNRIFFLFWVVMAIGVACIKNGNIRKSKAQNLSIYGEYSASVDIDK